MKYVYRYDDRPDWTGRNRVELLTFDVIRETESGFWITDYRSDTKTRERWVSSESKNGYAFDSKEKAWKNYVARKECQESILRGRLDEVRDILKWINDEDLDQSKTSLSEERLK